MIHDTDFVISFLLVICQVNGGFFIDGLILFQDVMEMDALESEETSGSIHVWISSVKGDFKSSVKVLCYPLRLSLLLQLWITRRKLVLIIYLCCDFLVQVMIQPVEVTYDSEFILNVTAFCNVLKTIKFQPERVSMVAFMKFIPIMVHSATSRALPTLGIQFFFCTTRKDPQNWVIWSLMLWN